MRRPLFSPLILPGVTGPITGWKPYVFRNAEAKALVARMTGVSRSRRRAIDTLVGVLKSANIWDGYDVFCIRAAHNAEASLLNWIGDQNNSILSVTPPTFVADRGWTGNGTSSYINMNFNPTAAPSPKFTQNSGHLSGWSLSNLVGGAMLGARISTSSRVSQISPRGAVDASTFGLNTAGTFAGTVNTDSTGRYTANRSAADATQVYKNNVAFGTSAAASDAIVNLDFYELAVNSNGTAANFGLRQSAASEIGRSFSQVEDGAAHAAILQYLQTVGAVV